MALKYLASLLKVNGKDVQLKSEQVYDKTRKQTVAEALAALDSAISSLRNGDIQTLIDDLEALESTVSAFLTGEDDNNDVLDRLKELVAAIQANKDSIDALVADKATKEELNAALGRIAALEAKSHEHANKEILDSISKSATGNLVCNDVELGVFTGIATAATVGETNDYSGKLQIVVEEFDDADAA
ncbi:hypothetical protein [Desulfovibrio sp. ZJ369]|uniref:hypothetical protein n=1 Tax=Desulfovibrio sp. ZJ369 TaxID=2709793 RepID=UPI0013ECE586|nr:hypothetical protein [Desulfovibrio sp. ZJ369]